MTAIQVQAWVFGCNGCGESFELHGYTLFLDDDQDFGYGGWEASGKSHLCESCIDNLAKLCEWCRGEWQ